MDGVGKMKEDEAEDSLTRVEFFHKIMHDNQQVMFSLKIGIFTVLGTIIILACTMYIILQCRKMPRSPIHLVKRRKNSDDLKCLLLKKGSEENVLAKESRISLGIKNSKEFFV
ncbi:hypothetical protein ACJMK2_023724 [Sinanodonta woodiana]|uniref:Uncharacterized protein n=1 Tax=Sinanodonta woodiana TaxID=1069815 RepID=A0ABD3T638_SINWO